MLLATLIASTLFAGPPVAAAAVAPGHGVRLVRPAAVTQPVVALRPLRLSRWFVAPRPQHVSRADSLVS